MRPAERPSKVTVDVERFMRHVVPVPESGCWLWIGEWNDGGYGRLWIRGKNHQAHRLSREDYIDRVTLNWLASTVKLADIAENIIPIRIREWEEVSGKSKASYVRGRLADYNRIVEALKQVSTEHKEQV